MANITNRSPYLITCPGHEPAKIRLKSKATEYLKGLKNPKAKLVQLETSFEVQIKLRDKEGNVVKATQTLSSYKEAEDWAKGEEDRILSFKEKNGKFDLSFENMTFEEALKRTIEEHYTGKASYSENKSRVPHIAEKIGKRMLLKDVDQKVLLKYRNDLKADGYSASSIRNFFVVISSTFKQAQMEWLFPVENHTKRIKLEKPDNAIERNWESKDEKDRLYASIRTTSPWLLPIVELCLDIGFRLGEVVKPTVDFPDSKYFGLKWEGVNFEEGTVRLFKEKNDWKKQNTELKGRIVPMTKRMREILLEAHGDLSVKKTGSIFKASRSSVSSALKNCLSKANPPIERFTFHSVRKIATYDLAKKIPNPVMLGKVTGHRDIVTLSRRYFKAQIDDLKALVNASDETDLVKRGLAVLKLQLGESLTEEFLSKVIEKALLESQGNDNQLELLE